MEQILRISSPYSEPWVGWTMAVLLALILFANYIQRGLLVNAFRDILYTKERDSLFSETLQNTYGKIALFTYKIGILALTIYVAVYQEVGGMFSLKTYGITIALTALYFALKYLITRYLAFVFLNKEQYQTALRNYLHLLTAFSATLYPILLVILFAPFITQTVTLIVLSVVFALFLIIFLWKAFQLFFTHVSVCLYIFLYLCTLEIMPLAALLYAVNYLAN